MFLVQYKGKDLSKKLALTVGTLTKKMSEAARAGVANAAAEIEDRGRANIASAGNFGTRWTQGLKAKVTITQQRTAKGQFSTNKYVIEVSHAVPYWMVFQEGRVIQGKPLLWIPLSWTDAVGTRARDYGQPLFRVDRKSGKAPLLLSFDGEPKYFGKASVKIPKKFRVLEIARSIGKNIKKYINLKDAR